MSTLTKVFALLVAILSIFLCGSQVTFMTTAQNYKNKFEDQKTIAEAANLAALAAQEELANFRENQAALAISLRKSLGNLQGILDSQGRELAAARKDSAVQVSRANTAVEVVDALSKSVDNMQSSQKTIWDAHNKSRAEKIEALTQYIELTRKHNQARAEIQNLTDTLDRRTEQVAHLHETVSTLKSQMDAVKVASEEFRSDKDVIMTPPQLLGVPIRGEVMEIRDNKIAISVGSSSGVQENMRFWIVRGENFLGNLDIIHVRADQAVGNLSNRQGAIVSGDAVTTDFN